MLQPFPYDALWHYSEKFTRDPDLRQDLVLMAYQQDKRFGEKSEIRLLKHFMKYRSLEVSTRNSLGKSVGGKSKRDAYSRERVSIFKRVCDGQEFCLAEMLTCVDRDPFASTVVDQFECSLSSDEHTVCDGMLGGYPAKDVKAKLGIDHGRYQELRNAVKEKALEYLM